MTGNYNYTHVLKPAVTIFKPFNNPPKLRTKIPTCGWKTIVGPCWALWSEKGCHVEAKVCWCVSLMVY